MAISSPLKSKIPKSSTTTVKKFQTILFNRTRVKKEIFQNKTILQNRRVENEKRVQAEEELEAPDIATKKNGPAQLISGSAKGFFERILGFLGYVTAGWIINNLPTWISMGKEFIARTQQMGRILGNFIKNTTDIFQNFTGLLSASLTNIMTFDFLDTSGRVGAAFEELQLSVDNWGTGFEDAIKLITTPLTEGIASGEDARPTGTQNTDEGAYERTAPYSGTPAPQINENLKFYKEQNIKPLIGQSGIEYVQVTSLRGNRIGGWHGGMDIAAPTGTYIALRVDCEVVASGTYGNYGLLVDVWVPQYGVQLRFAHNSSIIIGSGNIPAGTSFARVGSTGRSTGPHIHLESDTTKGRSNYGGSMDPSRFVPLILLTTSPSKQTPAPASVASSSTSQPQQNLMGNSSSSSSSGSGRFGTKEEIALNDAISFAEGTKSSYGTMFGGGISKDLESGKLTVKQVIDLGDAHAKKNGQSGAAGRYQFMPPTLEDLVRTGDLKMDDKFTPQMQDKASIALARRRKVTSELLKKEGLSAKVSNMLAPEWASLPTYSGASYYGQPVKSLSSIQSAYKNSLGSPQQPAPAQTSSPTTTKSTTQSSPTQTQAQITPTGTQQNTQANQSLTPERRGQTVIIAQNPSQPQQQTMPYGGGGSSGGGSSSQTSEFSLLNIFMKNKLLLDLAYL